MELTGSFFILAGSVFFFLSALGVVRMPDVFNRIQTGTKATTLGTMLMLTGAAFIHPEWAVKLAILILFILFTNPVSSHVVARGAHMNREKMSETTHTDKLKERQGEDK